MGLNIKKILQTAVGGGGGPSTPKKTCIRAWLWARNVDRNSAKLLKISVKRGGGVCDRIEVSGQTLNLPTRSDNMDIVRLFS